MIVYDDAYLAPFCTSVRESRASDYVDMLQSPNDFSQEWHDNLTRDQCYILVCIEQQGAPDDLFAEKLKTYQKKFDSELVFAKIDAAETAGSEIPLIFTAEMERA